MINQDVLYLQLYYERGVSLHSLILEISTLTVISLHSALEYDFSTLVSILQLLTTEWSSNY